MELGQVKYARNVGADFSKTLRKRVRGYFKENNITKNANIEMKVKTAVMLAIYLIPLSLIFFGGVTSFWAIYACYIVMGFGMAFVGMNVMHDAMHGSYSTNKLVNTILGYTISLCGGYPINWHFQHNVLHHSYTNIEGLDEDIEPAAVLRFSPFKKLLGHHKLQHLFAWFFYGLMTVLWSTSKDFVNMKKYKNMGLMEGQKRSYSSYLSELIALKVAYYAIIVILPMYLLPIPWYQTLVMYLTMHFVAGVTLGMVFQPAHVVPQTDFYSQEDALDMKTNFEVAQMRTTADFAPKSRIFSWFVGGLNYQVEHHLFPNICHIHYKKLSKIVKATAEEYNVPYYCNGSFISALGAHATMLKNLGTMENPTLAHQQ